MGRNDPCPCGSGQVIRPVGKRYMLQSRFDLIIIGGGIVGLATAMEARQRFPRLRLLLMEKEDRGWATCNESMLAIYFRRGIC